MKLDFHVPTVEEVLEGILNSDPCVVSVEADHLVLGNIVCVGSDGKALESYDKLKVNRCIEKDASGLQVNFTPYAAAAHSEKQKPETLTQIGQHFSKPAKIWVPSNKNVRAVWLGCSENYFDISTDGSLDYYDASREVQYV